jgi:hypothetical protein
VAVVVVAEAAAVVAEAAAMVAAAVAAVVVVVVGSWRQVGNHPPPPGLRLPQCHHVHDAQQHVRRGPTLRLSTSLTSRMARLVGWTRLEVEGVRCWGMRLRHNTR